MQQQEVRHEATAVETGGKLRRDTLQFVHDKLVNAPVGVDARERNKVAMVRIYARIAECLERRHMRCLAGLIRDLGRRWRRREQERQLGHPVPAGHHALDDRGLEVDMVLPLLQGHHLDRSNFWRHSFGILLVYIRFHVCGLLLELHCEVVYPI